MWNVQSIFWGWWERERERETLSTLELMTMESSFSLLWLSIKPVKLTYNYYTIYLHSMPINWIRRRHFSSTLRKLFIGKVINRKILIVHITYISLLRLHRINSYSGKDSFLRPIFFDHLSFSHSQFLLAIWKVTKKVRGQ